MKTQRERDEVARLDGGGNAGDGSEGVEPGAMRAGVPDPEAVALSLGVFFLVVLNSCIGGIVYMWKGHELPSEMEANQEEG